MIVRVRSVLFLACAAMTVELGAGPVEEIKGYIESQYVQQYPSIEFEGVSLLVRSGLDVMDIDIVRMDVVPNTRSKGQVIVGYKKGGATQQKEVIRYTVRATLKVFRTTQSMKSRQDFTVDTIKESSIDLADLNGIPAYIEEILDSSSNGFMSADSVIYKNKLTKKILVRKDSQITLFASSNGVRVTQIAKAMQNGTKGEQIKVQNPNSKKILQATVVGKNEAIIN